MPDYFQCSLCAAYVPAVLGAIHVCRDDRGEHRSEVYSSREDQLRFEAEWRRRLANG